MPFVLVRIWVSSPLSFVNAYDILATKDNGDDIGTDAGTVCTCSVVTYVIGNLIVSLDQASSKKNSERNREGWTEVIPTKSSCHCRNVDSNW